MPDCSDDRASRNAISVDARNDRPIGATIAANRVAIALDRVTILVDRPTNLVDRRNEPERLGRGRAASR
jgi:hypothetical protein